MGKELVSIIIPARKEQFLNQTIQDVLSNATGEIELFVILDGYEPDELIEDPRLRYIRIPNCGSMQKRIGINTAVQLAKGKFVMSLDAHCMVAKGFDEVLARDCERNMVMIPRRYKLDPIAWKVVKEFGSYDRHYWMWSEFSQKKILKDYRWDRGEDDIRIDDTLTTQASCWFMTKEWFNKMRFMRIEGYTGWGQEDVELCMETWTNGGRVVVNKNTWYAHLFKGKRFGKARVSKDNYSQHSKSRKYAYDYWVHQRKEDFIKVINKFMPIPNWPPNWEKIIYG